MITAVTAAMRRLLLVFVVVALAVFGLGVWNAQQAPKVVRHAVVVPGLATRLHIVQLSDIHASRIDMPPERLAAVVAQANALKPDLIVLTGDYISGDPARWTMPEIAVALQPLRALRAPLGVFASLGNHDDPARTMAALRGSAVRLLVGNSADAGPVTIIGADDLDRGSVAVEAMRDDIREAPPGKPVVVIAHEPTFFFWLQARPVLLLAGHTHGGQIDVPVIGGWPLDAYQRAHKRGLFHSGAQQMIVSSGIGTTALPIRFGVSPEIVLLTLYPGRNSGTDR